MSNGFEEQNAINSCGKNIEDTKKRLNLEEVVQRDSLETSNSGIDKSNVRVRTNGMPHTLPNWENNNSNQNQTSYYTGMPIYQTTESSNNKAFAAVLVVMEVVSLIFLVSLITFVVLKGIS